MRKMSLIEADKSEVCSQIPVSEEGCGTSSTTQFECSSKSSFTMKKKKSVLSKLFSWNREKPRPSSEYVDKKFDKPFNKVAPELRMIGGLGPIKCVAKQERQPLINRPTQVQKLSHTTTKLLPNFALTEQLRPVACSDKKKLSVLSAAERVKLVENLPCEPSTSSSSSSESGTKAHFNHQNPFNLDLDALSEYQKQKHNAEEKEGRRNYQIIRRTMETKALKTDGAERIVQEARNEKFKLPEFFKVSEESGAAETGEKMSEI